MKHVSCSVQSSNHIVPSVSAHSILRAKQRLDVSAKYLENLAFRAWFNGKSVDDYTGKCRKMLLEIAGRVDPENTALRTHGNVLYIFTIGGVLKTVYPVREDFLRANRKNVRRPRGVDGAFGSGLFIIVFCVNTKKEGSITNPPFCYMQLLNRGFDQ